MKVVTKKFEQEKKGYISTGIKLLLKSEGKWAIAPLAIIIAGAFLPRHFWWMFTVSILGAAGYVGFRALQMFGFTQHEMSKVFFMKKSYELDGRYLMMVVSPKEKMPVEWKNFKSVEKTKDSYILSIARGQFITLPFSVFKNENDKKLTETIFKRKNLL